MRQIISFLYSKFLKPVFFKFDPEFVHDRMIMLGNLTGKISIAKKIIKKIFRYESNSLEQNLFGINFKNPVGLSAGFDKNADLLDILYYVGFGFMVVGSVTLFPYQGNTKPRLKRLPKSKSIWVYYGLKNIGVDKIIKKLKKAEKNQDFPIGISIAKTNSQETCDDQEAILDYFETFKKLSEENQGSFYTINISCPNTFGGEPFTTPEKLNNLLKKLFEVKTLKPVFIKMPISIPWQEFKELLDVIIKYPVKAVVIGNLNKNLHDQSVVDDIGSLEKGGLSGKPTEKLSNELIGKTYQLYGDRLKIIGVGGIFDAEDAYKKIKLGASLVQIITGMIYQGPQTIGEINKGLDKLLQADGFTNIGEAVGSDFAKK